PVRRPKPFSATSLWFWAINLQIRIADDPARAFRFRVHARTALATSAFRWPVCLRASGLRVATLQRIPADSDAITGRNGRNAQRAEGQEKRPHASRGLLQAVEILALRDSLDGMPGSRDWPPGGHS